MAAPTYAKDMTDVSLATSTTGWTEPTATGWTGGGAATVDADYPYIQGGSTTNSVLQAATKTGVAALLYNYGSGITIPTDGALLVWHLCYSVTLLDSYESGGIRVMMGSSLAAFLSWDVGGLNAGRNPYGGWQNFAVNPTVSPDDTLSTGLGNGQYVGAAISLTAGVSKGYPNIVDAIRYGRCEARFTDGDLANGYATFAGFAAANDADTARWGLIQAIAGGYLWKGLMTLGYSTAVDFRDSNKVIFIDDTRKVTANFNKIEIRQAGSRVDWIGITFSCTSPLTTASKGRLEVVDDCDVNISNCTFTDMDTFIFKASSDVLSSVFRRCGQITANDAKFAGTNFDSSSAAIDTSALVWDVATDPSTDLSGCSFTKGENAHHAIEFGTTSPTSMTLTNVIFSGFNGSNAQNDSAIHIKRTEGEVTLTITGGTSPSYKTAGATVTIVTSSRTVKAIVQTADGTKIQSARVLLKVSADASGGFPYDDTVTITNSSTTATVSHTSHGMLTNDKVVISGASLTANNGVFIITKLSDNSYTYTMLSSPGSNPIGTIKASFVFLEGATDSNGELSMSRAIGAAQAVTGWARKSSGAPYYKQGPVSGIISTSSDSTFTAILSQDQ